MSQTSPCIKICQLDQTRTFCIGCGRTLAEIRSWPFLTTTERQEIIKRLATSYKNS
ncbi:MAG: DUF1289 domain-containing protein [Alphaproteobacteria bacterium]|nr:DUF1289 domain-containing protein [Alphaproteobacteria bacterium]